MARIVGGLVSDRKTVDVDDDCSATTAIPTHPISHILPILFIASAVVLAGCSSQAEAGELTQLRSDASAPAVTGDPAPGASGDGAPGDSASGDPAPGGQGTSGKLGKQVVSETRRTEIEAAVRRYMAAIPEGAQLVSLNVATEEPDYSGGDAVAIRGGRRYHLGIALTRVDGQWQVTSAFEIGSRVR